MSRELANFLSEHRIKGARGVVARKLLARAYRRLGHPRLALRLLAQLPANPMHWWRIAGDTNEIAAALAAAGLVRRADVLDALLIYSGVAGHFFPSTRKVSQQARARRGQRRLVRDQLVSAERDLAKVTQDPRSPAVIDIGPYVDALTWHADLLKVRGDYADSLDLVNRATAEWPYSNYSQRAYALWKRAEIRLLSGWDVNDVDSDLETAYRFAERARDSTTKCWVRTTMADAAIERDLSTAHRLLREAEVLLVSGNDYTAQYLLLLKAEIARIEGNDDERRRHTTELRRIVGTRKRAWGPGRTALLAAELIDADAERYTATNESSRLALVHRLETVALAYRRIGAAVGEARAQVLLAAVRRQSLSPELVGAFSYRGWHRELARAESPDDPRCSWHIYM